MEKEKILDESFECPKCKHQSLYLTDEFISPINGYVGYTYTCYNPDCEHEYSV